MEQYITKSVLDTLRLVTDTPEDVEAVLKVMNKLAIDLEPSVRAELMEQVPHIAMYCQEFKSKLAYVVPDSLLPMVVQFLTDIDIQVRKTSQAALLVLLDQGLLEKSDVKEQVCPVIIRLTEADSLDDYRTEAVALLSKLAPMIGKEMSEAIFLERFAALCMDPLFHVRKVCAANFGDFSSVVGTESTEKVLLPKFFYLCEDGVWGVRKACADVFMPVSCVCSPSVRKAKLSPIFVNLLKDQSRWVRMTAYQALGPFISTFADSNITSLLHNDNGEIVITDRELLAQRLADFELREEEPEQEENNTEETEVKTETLSTDCDETSKENFEQVISMEVEDDETEVAKEQDSEHLRRIVHSKSLNDLSPEEDRAKSYEPSSSSSSATLTSSESFNNFLYWRDPLPVLEDLPSEDPTEAETENSPDSERKDESSMEMFRPDSSINNSNQLVFDPNTLKMNNNQQQSSFLSHLNDNNQQAAMQDPALPRGPPATLQSLVPQLLVDHFVSMTDPSRAQTVDSEIAHHCAFSLPAVALTLGRRNWPLLRETYDILASDMQWKVRRTLASSIHELGVILGQEAVVQDLIPIFNGFLKDLDEVRIGLLKHLADFLKLLPLELRKQYLPKMSDFLNMDNDRNWRFRQELAVQLGHLVPLYTAEEIKTHLAPIALILIRDKVAAVRKSAVDVHSIMVKYLIEDSSQALVRVLLADLMGDLVRSESWIHRQTYASLALALFDESSLEHTQYAQDVLPHLLDLSEDKVPNVRLAVARALKPLSQATYFTKEANPHQARMEKVTHILTEDQDPDVKSFFAEPQAYDSDGEPINDISSLPV
jgi:serine/threonine-protein phosphatase 4 regulatory subunit 1